MPSYAFSPRYTMDWAGHVFPVRKYELVYEKLIREGVVKRTDFLEPMPATTEELLLVHTERYLQELGLIAQKYPESVYAEIPIRPEVVDTFKLATGGSILAAREAMKRGAGANLSGGFHHAFADHGEGFCLINDMAVAIRVLQKEELIKRATVIDCDLHQGNGTARIFANDENVYTFSIHQEHNYPVKEQSDWDIGLKDYTVDEEYLAALEDAVPKILDEHKPDLVVYQAGADPYKEDLLGLLKISKEGLAERDEIVYRESKKRELPVAVYMGGGYAHRMEDVVDIHFNTLKLLSEYF